MKWLKIGTAISLLILFTWGTGWRTGCPTGVQCEIRDIDMILGWSDVEVEMYDRAGKAWDVTSNSRSNAYGSFNLSDCWFSGIQLFDELFIGCIDSVYIDSLKFMCFTLGGAGYSAGDTSFLRLDTCELINGIPGRYYYIYKCDTVTGIGASTYYYFTLYDIPVGKSNHAKYNLTLWLKTRTTQSWNSYGMEVWYRAIYYQ